MKLFYALLLGMMLACKPAAAAEPGYHLLKSISLPGDKGWDLLTVDSAAKRLYASHGDQVLVVDIASDTLVAAIGPFEGTHGIALLNDLNRGYITDGKADSLLCFDLKTLAPLAHIAVGKKPDVVIVDPMTERVWCFNADGHSVTVIQAGDNTVLKTIDLGGAPEFAVADGKGRVFVNLEDKSQLLKIDSNKMAVLEHWDIAPGDSPSSLSLDGKGHRLFIGCHNLMTVVMNSENGRIVAHLPIGDRVDGSAYDAAKGLVFHSCGDGTLSVIRQDDADHYSLAENVATQRGARTMALDPACHRLYLPSADFGEAPAATEAEPHPRPKMKPGSFRILVYGAE